MFAASKTASVSAAVPDGQFNYVTMLLHGDGTNGAQNNTFLDSSTNAFSITRNGNTTQGSFSPYGSNWSNYFNGSTDYVTFPSNTAFDLGSSNFTIEGWFCKAVLDGGIDVAQSRSDLAATTRTFQIGASGGSNDLWSGTVFVGSTGYGITATTVVKVNTWYHIALVKNSTTMTLYVNGTSEGTVTVSGSINSGINPLTFGRLGSYNGYYSAGYISNFRYVVGTAVYTSNFTPSTVPLTAITNTKLLTCQSNRFIDNSSNAFTATVNGTPSVQRFNPFGASTAYSTSVIGGSGYFDGSGDYLGISNNTALQWGTGDFCVEMWVNPSSASGGKELICKGTNNSGTFEIGIYASNKIELYTTALVFTSSASAIANAWTHVAITRSGTTLRCFINGVLDTTVTSYSYDFNNTSTFYVGIYGGDLTSNPFNGYMSDVRCVKGSAVYTSAFTPNTAPLTAITNTQLLLNTTNGAIFDNAMMNDLETVGNAQISTSVKKYGTGSLYFDGSGDYLFEPATQLLAWGTGNFTIEMWINTSTTSISGGASRTMWGTASASYQGQLYLEISTGKVVFGNTGSTFVKGTSNVADGNWNHIAISRSGTTCKLFVNGTQEASGTNSVNYDAQPTFIGAFGASDGYFNGYIDDLRVTKGYARYTATFTPPTAALSDTGPY